MIKIKTILLLPFVIGLVLFFNSCNQIPSDISFSVINETRNDTLKKVNVNIRINKKVDKEVLKLIGNKLKTDLQLEKYSKIWMFYFLPNTKVGSGAWATTHFTPNLKVEFYGATKKQSKKQENIAGQDLENIIGKWKEEQYTSAIYIIYKKENELFIRTIYPNSQISDVKIKENKGSKVVRYDYYSNGYNGEYFKVKNNILEFYNKENKMYTKGFSFQ